MNRERLKGHLDLLLLSVLTAGPAHGYAVISELRRRSEGTFDLPEGTVYPALHRLEEAYIDPSSSARTTAFFYVLGLAAQDPDTYREFLASIDAWIELFTVLGMREGRGREAAHARAHAVVWAARGAMFQALATGERSAALRVFRQVLAELDVTRG